MSKIIITVLFLIMSISSFATSKMHISFQSSQIKQGSIVDARIIFDAGVVQRVDLSKIRNTTLSEYFYVYEADLPLRKMGEDSIGSDAKIIVLKIPNSQPVNHTIENEKIEITWNNIEFLPTEAGKGFVFGDFNIPEKRNFVVVAIICLLLIIVSLSGWKIFNKIKIKKIEKERIKLLKKNIESAATYEDIVTVWKKKAELISEFPHLEEHFKNLEVILFKYQFKFSQTESEKNIVIEAYKDFIEKIKGGFNGI